MILMRRIVGVSSIGSGISGSILGKATESSFCSLTERIEAVGLKGGETGGVTGKIEDSADEVGDEESMR
jgi:hypothetical protein